MLKFAQWFKALYRWKGCHQGHQPQYGIPDELLDSHWQVIENLSEDNRMSGKIYFSESCRNYFEELNSEEAYLNNFPDIIFSEKI